VLCVLIRSASDANLPKNEDQMAEDGDPTKTQPVKDPPAILSKALNLVASPDENWYESLPCLTCLKSSELS